MSEIKVKLIKSRIGTTPAMPTREEIDAFLAEH